MSRAFSRRDVLKAGVFGTAALSIPFIPVASAKSLSQLAASKLPRPYTLPFKTPPVLSPKSHPDYPGADFYVVQQQLANVEIVPGYKTPIFGYNGIAPGPTIVAQKDRPVVVRQINSLPANHPALRYRDWTSTHLHGSPSQPQYDGYASDITQPGQYKDYVYENRMSARTLWYHDHGVHHTAENAYMGLAAAYVSYDATERALPLPKGDYDKPVILSDKAFTSNGALLYDDNSQSSTFGDVVTVNGVPWPNLKVARRKYRFRILNASLSRGYNLYLSDGSPMTIVGTDGGLMPAPQSVKSFRIGMAERYEVVIDFAKYTAGAKIRLLNRGVPNSVDYDHTGKVMQFEVTDEAFDTANNEVPAVLDPEAARGVMGLSETGAIKRQMRLERSNGEWQISGTTWKTIEDSGFKHVFANPQPGTTEIWSLQNNSGGWFHPLHIHLVDFKILSRNGAPPPPHERGPKDTAYIGENETVNVLMRFHAANEDGTNYPADRGRYMVHCHNLTHEDHDMMTQFRVGDVNDQDIDPIKAAPAKNGPAPAG